MHWHTWKNYARPYQMEQRWLLIVVVVGTRMLPQYSSILRNVPTSYEANLDVLLVDSRVERMMHKFQSW